MTQEFYDVCLTGNVLTGHNRREVSVNLAQLVGTTIVQAESLLDSATCVKSQVDRETADHYHEILEETGAEAVIRICLAASEQHVVTSDPVASSPDANALPAAVEEMIQPEATPVLAELSLPEPADAHDQDTTQPFAVVPPAPYRRRALRWLWPGMIAVVTVAVVLALIGWLLPGPVTPGQGQMKVGESLNLAQPYQQRVEQYWRQQGQPPAQLPDLQLAATETLGTLATLSMREGGILVLTYLDGAGNLAGQTLELAPMQTDQGLEWHCTGGTLGALERPLECRRSLVQ